MSSLFAVVLCAALCVTEAILPRQVKGEAETSERVEIVKPVVLYRSDNNTYPQEIWIAVRTRKLKYTLQLKRNNGLIGSGFSSTHFDQDGKEIVLKDYSNCFYHGEVQGYPDWKATIGTCYGIHGSFGDVADNHHYYHVEPVEWGNEIEKFHALFVDSDLTHPNRTCGHVHDNGDRDEAKFGPPPMQEDMFIEERLRRQVNGYSVVELVIVSDFAHYQAHGSSVDNVVNKALSVTNDMDEVFQALRIRVVLVGVVVWNMGDQINVDRNPFTLLYNFRDYKPQIRTPHDSALLLTGENLEGSTAGAAFVRSMCDQRSSASLTEDRGGVSANVAGFAAHEMGHLFNMGHDMNDCECATSKCIMAGSLSTPVPTSWSSCSTESLERGFMNFNLGRCLSNAPSTTVGDPVCGNGIREGDEICDCGSVEECTDPCCDAVRCQLVEGALCHSGPCCDQCQFRPYGTTCRESMGECDITEYCSGESSDCPEDTTQQDGTPCNNGQAFCYSGHCRTYNEQCQRFFASDKGVNDCYERYNVEGTVFGNCGHNLTHFHRCNISDVFCGQLQCQNGDFQLTPTQLGARVTVGRAQAFNEQHERVTCRSFTPDPGEFQNPGLVQDGTKCGSNQLCFGQRCVAISKLGISQCPVGNGGLICSGSSNGFCNNFGLCSCRVGFIGSACENQTSINILIPSSSENRDTMIPSPSVNGGNRNEPSVGASSKGTDNTAAAVGGAVGGAAVIGIIVVCVIIAIVVLIKWKKRRPKQYYQSREQKVPPSRPVPVRESQSNLLKHVDTGLSTTEIIPPPPAYDSIFQPSAPPMPIAPVQRSAAPEETEFTAGYTQPEPQDEVREKVRRPPPRPPAHSQTSPRPTRPPPPTKKSLRPDPPARPANTLPKPHPPPPQPKPKLPPPPPRRGVAMSNLETGSVVATTPVNITDSSSPTPPSSGQPRSSTGSSKKPLVPPRMNTMPRSM